VYLFSGADGDTLWTFPTGNRLYAVSGAPDLSGNLTADVLGGTQYLSNGGRAYALEGGDLATPVPDLLTAHGQAVRHGREVQLQWQVSAPWPCVVDRLVLADGDKARQYRRQLATTFERGDLDTRGVLATIQADKDASFKRLTPRPVLPTGDGRYLLVDADAPAGRVRYRVSAVLPDQGEVLLLELTPAGESAPARRLRDAAVVPNPFNPRTEVRLVLDQAASVSVAIHDARGRRVAALGPRRGDAGPMVLRWDGTGFDGRALPAGTYLLRITAGDQQHAVKAALVR
jgi:hypothetical protein